MSNNDDKIHWPSVIYNEVFIFWLPLMLLGYLFGYSIYTGNTLLIVMSVSFFLGRISMEGTIRRRSTRIVSYDLMSIRVFERISYILIVFAVVIGIIMVLHQIKIIGR